MTKEKKILMRSSFEGAIEAVDRCRELLINADAPADDLAEYDCAVEALRLTVQEYLA